jgi:hypothetical protein
MTQCFDLIKDQIDLSNRIIIQDELNQGFNFGNTCIEES